MDITGVIAKINTFFIIFTEVSPYFEAEKVTLFRKNIVRACGPRGCLLEGAFEKLKDALVTTCQPKYSETVERKLY
jgi:hypothetical protein